MSQSVLHTVEAFFNLNLVENANENGLYDFSISMMRPVLILTEPRGCPDVWSNTNPTVSMSVWDGINI